MARKHSKRKYAAVALGIIGVAGLSVASAATLNVNAANEVAIGTDTFAACADSVDVGYTYDSASYTIEALQVTNIDAACNGQDIRVVLEDATEAQLAAGTGVVAGGAFTLNVTDSNIDIATDLGEVTVVIG